MCAKLKTRKYIQTYSYMNGWSIQIFFVLYLWIGIALYWNKNIAFCEVLFRLLQGFSYQAFDVTEFLYYIFFFLFPIFLIHAFWETRKSK